MKKFLITMILVLAIGPLLPTELYATSTPVSSEAAPKKAAKKSGSKKYVPASVGDCYLGEAMYYQGDSQNVELTLYPNGTCEWKANGKLQGKGTFSGSITGRKYVVKVDIPNVGKYTFKGTKNEWNFEGPYESITLNLEY